VGTRTSFYGFTAFSLTQSLLILGRRGFQHVPLGKVSEGVYGHIHTLDKGGCREKGRGAPCVCMLCGWHRLYSYEGKSREDSQARPQKNKWAVGSQSQATPACGSEGVLLDHLLSLVLRTSATYTSWKAPGTMSGWRQCF
jgi:hypothetical protein